MYTSDFLSKAVMGASSLSATRAASSGVSSSGGNTLQMMSHRTGIMMSAMMRPGMTHSKNPMVTPYVEVSNPAHRMLSEWPNGVMKPPMMAANAMPIAKQRPRFFFFSFALMAFRNGNAKAMPTATAPVSVMNMDTMAVATM